MKRETVEICGEELKCEICEVNKSIGVFSLSLGPMSMRYCKRCVEEKAQPKWAVAWTVDNIGGIDNLADWAKDLSYYDDGQYKNICSYKKEQ